MPHTRVATFARFRNPADGETLDEGLSLFFPGPASFTGEDCAELQIHGSPATIAATTRVLALLHGLREARPGEFTRRALSNGKLDLSQAEALADLIDAQTDRQRRLAFRAKDEGPARLSERWRQTIVDCAAEIEARLDFADEGDVAALGRSGLKLQLLQLAADVQEGVRQAQAACRLREGYFIAICGPPNSGKSSLLNALTGRDQAIVSPYAGTTRDTIEVCLDIGGAAVTFCDTAGIRDASDPVEAIGVERARRAAERADFTLWLEAPDARAEPGSELRVDLRVLSKADLPNADTDAFRLSARTGEGIESLVSLIADKAAGDRDDGSDAAGLRTRHILRAGRLALDIEAAATCVGEDRLEIAAAHLVGALAHLDALGSKTADEDVLDQVFGRFCIGK